MAVVEGRAEHMHTHRPFHKFGKRHPRNTSSACCSNKKAPKEAAHSIFCHSTDHSLCRITVREEGGSVVEEAIQFVKSQPQLQAMGGPEQGLSLAAEDHVADIGAKQIHCCVAEM
eukprot:1494988-Amphidinium_carterae.1